MYQDSDSRLILLYISISRSLESVFPASEVSFSQASRESIDDVLKRLVYFSQFSDAFILFIEQRLNRKRYGGISYVDIAAVIFSVLLHLVVLLIIYLWAVFCLLP